MDIKLPEGVSEKDALAFLDYLEKHPKAEPRPTMNCSNCYFGPECQISVDCKTLIFNHKKPTRWLAKKGVRK